MALFVTRDFCQIKRISVDIRHNNRHDNIFITHNNAKVVQHYFQKQTDLVNSKAFRIDYTVLVHLGSNGVN